MAFLPPTTVIFLENPRRHLRYVQESGNQNGLLRFDQNMPLNSQYVKMDVELAQTGDGLVHLRCVYNSRYWRRSSASEWSLKAESREPEDDQSNWSCTLFKPEREGTDGIRLRHMQTGLYVGLQEGRPFFPNCLYLGTTEMSTFKFVDWDQLLFLPKYVAFKKNGKFLKPSPQMFDFTSDDFAEPAASYEIITTPDGDIILKNDYLPTYWMIALPVKIAAVFLDADSRAFRPFKAGKDATTNVELIAIGTKMIDIYRFCHVSPPDRFYNIPHLSAELLTITNQAKMEVVERVFSREIYNVQFRQMDGRIYNEQIIDAGHQEISNRGSEPVDATLTFTYTNTTSKKWEHNVSASLSVSTTIKTGIPFLAGGEISMSAEAGYSHTWGTEESSTTERTTSTVWVVPPMKKHTVRLLVTRASFDVPFSYTQRDRLTNGHFAVEVRHDGVFKGVNTTIFKYEAEEEDV